MIFFRRLLLLFPLLFTCAIPACQKDDEPRRAVRPPVVIDESTMLRLLAAMQELQDLSRAHPLAQQNGIGVLPVGMGITAMLGEPGARIITQHGFASTTEFESKVGYIQAALMQLLFQGRHGFDGDAQLYRLNGKLSDLKAHRLEVENDNEISTSDRRLSLTEIRLQIEAIEERIEDVQDFAATMDDGYSNLPEENLASLKAHIDEVLPLIDPTGTLTTTPPGK